MTKHRDDLPPMPHGIGKLPVDDRGYPVPWFVAWINGKPDFRVIHPRRMVPAIRHNRCWICGERMEPPYTFPIGPMCAVNRNIAEPPSHHACAKWSAEVCPFLTLPKAKRRDASMPDGTKSPAGIGISRNPGVVCLWTTYLYEIFNPGTKGGSTPGVLFSLGEPVSVEWICEGRPATRAKVEDSIRSGLPLLEELAVRQDEEQPGAGASLALARMVEVSKIYWPDEGPGLEAMGSW